MHFGNLAIAAGTAALIACAGSAFAQSPAPGAAAEDPVVARVDGAEIRRSDVEAAHAQLPEQFRGLPLERIYQPLLTQLIRSKLLSTAARQQNLDNDDDYKRRLAMVEERLLEEALIRKAVTATVTEEALRARYNERVDQFPRSEEVHARHILVKEEKEALEIIKQLEGGADFEKLAAEKSIGPSKTRGGDLGYFGRGQMVKSFEDAAFALEKGTITKTPVQSQFGYHVIRLEDRRQSAPPSFDEAKEQLGQEMSQKVAEDTVRALTEKAKIQRFELDGSAPRLRPVTPAPPAR